ncbi:MAG TPA: O-antigen ligase family protein [Candidatus Angelobacter sp.]|nr:O-antigen ligase family protein [Candidatus Angelobacter sp.]
MEHPPTSRSILQTRPGLGEELLIVGIAVGLTLAALLTPVALPLAVSGLAFILAALRFKLLLPAVIFFLPLTPFLDWNFPIRDLSTLVRFSMFAGVVAYRLSHGKGVREWLWNGWLTRAIIGYFAVAIASVAFNAVTLDAQRELMRLASYVCFYYVITDWMQTRRDTETLVKILMASTIVVALFGLYQVMIGGYTALYDVLYPVQEEIRQIPPWEGRITSFLEHYNGLAAYINLVVPFCFVFALRGADPALRTLSKWCLALASVALLLTQSRGGLLAYVAMLMVNAYMLAPDRKTRMRRLALVLVVCVLAAAVAGFFFQRLGEIDDYTAVSRLAIWGGAFTVFARSPVMGAGFGNLRPLMGGLLGLPEGWMGDAHNLYLELLAESGLVGFIAFAFLIVSALRAARRWMRESRDEFAWLIAIAAFAALCGVLVHGTVDYLFHTTPQVAALFFLVLGILTAQTLSSEAGASQTWARP